MTDMRGCGWLLAFVAAAAATACGDNLKPAEDARVGLIDASAQCGNGEVEAGEDCDDGNTDVDIACDSRCRATCGNGDLDQGVGELCDTAIGSGAGACPTTCDDGLACTADVLVGSECLTGCTHADITEPAAGDGCCPPGATSITDSDCAPVCGNMLVEAGEACDTAIAAGGGACPTTCNDGQACTTDALDGGGTCGAMCSATPITAPANNDGCCPAGATPASDNDCRPGCGNGVVDPGETCDTGIPVGPGACPTTCSDGMACTRDVLVNGGTCTASCTFPAITTPMNGDGCCPAGANANNDGDCPPSCGNMVVEGTEQCDDGNPIDTDSCNNNCMLTMVPPTVFRMNDLDLRDPHLFVNFVGCRDVTDTPLAGFSVNGELQTNIQTDGDTDGLLDLSFALAFRPLAQGATTTVADLYADASCTTPLASPSCSPGAATPTRLTLSNLAAGQCLTFLPGTARPYSPAITSTGAPCFSSSPTTITVNLGGIPVTLRDARLAATYVGVPAGNLVNGLLRGFISEADANATIIPATVPLVGGMPLSALLPGGAGNCAAHSDKDLNNGVMGWWFYFNFTAPRVTWTGP